MGTELDRLFYPKSIAVVGASPSMTFGKLPYYQIIGSMGYQGRLYAVNPNYTEIQGVTVYPSLEAIPEPVDLAIVSVSSRMALEVLESAVRQEVRFVHFFSSGFSETGDDGLEEAMLRMVRGGKTRILGPNCLGVHCTESRVIWDPVYTRAETGNIGFLSQSGGLTNNFLRLVQSRDMGINKAVSYGNQIDIGVEEFLEYFAQDAQISAIAAYIEDVKDGKGFLDALKAATEKKPVVILRGGITDQGAQAAASHTAALALNPRIWSSAMRQYGAIEVRTLEEMLHVIQIATSRKVPLGPKLGFVTAGGGASVLFTDLAGLQGLRLPGLETGTRKRIRKMIPDVNTSIENPVDLGVYGFDFNVVSEIVKALDEDKHMDAIVPFFCLDLISSLLTEHLEKGPQFFADTAARLNRPVIPVLANYMEDDLRIEQVRSGICRLWRRAGLPVYSTIQEAAWAITKILGWTRNRYPAGAMRREGSGHEDP